MDPNDRRLLSAFAVVGAATLIVWGALAGSFAVPTGEGGWFYHYQGFAAGILAIVAAFIAARPIYRQLDETLTQRVNNEWTAALAVADVATAIIARARRLQQELQANQRLPADTDFGPEWDDDLLRSIIRPAPGPVLAPFMLLLRRCRTFNGQPYPRETPIVGGLQITVLRHLDEIANAAFDVTRTVTEAGLQRGR